MKTEGIRNIRGVHSTLEMVDIVNNVIFYIVDIVQDEVIGYLMVSFSSRSC